MASAQLENRDFRVHHSGGRPGQVQVELKLVNIIPLANPPADFIIDYYWIIIFIFFDQ
jgi:hypothetical protein